MIVSVEGPAPALCSRELRRRYETNHPSYGRDGPGYCVYSGLVDILFLIVYSIPSVS